MIKYQELVTLNTSLHIHLYIVDGLMHEVRKKNTFGFANNSYRIKNAYMFNTVALGRKQVNTVILAHKPAIQG